MGKVGGKIAIMASRAVETGPTGDRVAANVFALRRARGLNQPQLAASMEAAGRPVHATAISKIEQQDRRVDVDDLVALAIALGVSPNRLLLPARPDESKQAELTPDVTVTADEAWKWALGLQPLARDLEQAARDGEDARVELWQRFIDENRGLTRLARDVQAFARGFDPVLFAAPGDRQAVAHNVLGTLMAALKQGGLTTAALHQLVDAAAATVVSLPDPQEAGDAESS